MRERCPECGAANSLEAWQALEGDNADLEDLVKLRENQRDNLAMMLRRLMHRTRYHEETKALWDDAHDLMTRMECAPSILREAPPPEVHPAIDAEHPTMSNPGPSCPKCRLPLSAHTLGECPR